MPDSDSPAKNAAPWDLVAVGGGAASFFAAITAAEASPNLSRILILEKTSQVLGKVKISGGGRCNVTHSCFDPRDFASHYPRGERSLIGPLSRWGSADTIGWFEAKGVHLKTEPDGRIFPASNSSQTVIDCLLRSARDTGIVVKTHASAHSAIPIICGGSGGARFALECSADGSPTSLQTRSLLLATGGTRAESGSRLVAALGHHLEPPVPSLFTFHIAEDPRLDGLQGLSVAVVDLSVPSHNLAARGPLLVTHWGLSGPAVLRLSAWGARTLCALSYNFDLLIDWLPEVDVDAELASFRNAWPKRTASIRSPFHALPKRLWERLAAAAGILPGTTWARLSNRQISSLATELRSTKIKVGGKSLNKEEFVTCGGVSLKEVDLRTMESRIHPGLFFAGEILDIDGLTGGFNFQNAWTTGHLAGSAIAAAAANPT